MIIITILFTKTMMITSLATMSMTVRSIRPKSLKCQRKEVLRLERERMIQSELAPSPDYLKTFI